MGTMSIQKRRQQMAALLARRDREGLTYEELSEVSGVPAGTLASWKSRFRREQQGSEFAELTDELVPTENDGRLEVVGPLGHTVRFDGSIDPHLLKAILAALPC